MKFIRVDPPAVQFYFQVGKDLKASIQLTSICDEPMIVYVKPSGMRRYFINHPKIALAPHAFGIIEITCEALRAKPSSFMVKDVIALECMLESPAGGKSNSPSLIQAFGKRPDAAPRVAETVKIPITFVDYESSPPLKRSSSDQVQQDKYYSPQGSMAKGSVAESVTSTSRPTSFREFASPTHPAAGNSTDGEEIERLKGQLEAALEQGREHTKRVYKANDTIRELREELQSVKEELEDQTSSARNSMQQLEFDLADARAEINSLQGKLEQAEKVCTQNRLQYEDLLREKKQLIKTMEEQMKDMCKEFEHRMTEMDSSQQQKQPPDDKDPQLMELKKELLAMSKACESSIGQIKDLQEEIEYVEAQRKQAVAQAEALRQRAEAAESQKKILQEDLKLMSGRASQQQNEERSRPSSDSRAALLLEYRESNENMEDEVLSLMRDKEQMLDTIDALKSALADMQDAEEASEIVEQNQQLAERVARLLRENEEMAARMRANGGSDAVLAELREQLQEYKEENRNMADEIQFLTRSQEQYNSPIPDLTDNGAAAAAAMVEELEAYKTECGNLSKEVLVLLGENRTKKQLVARLEESLAREREEFEAGRHELESRVQQLAAEKERVVLRLSEAENQFSSSSTANQSGLKAQIDELRGQLAECVKEKAALEQSMATLRAEKDELVHLFRALEGDNEDMRSQLSNLQESLLRSEESFTESERFVESLRRQIQSLQEAQVNLENDAQRKAMAEVRSLRSELNQSHQQTQEVITQMERMQSLHDTKVEELQTHIRELQRNGSQEGNSDRSVNPINDLKRQLATLQEECAGYKATIHDLTAQLTSSEEVYLHKKEALELDLYKEKMIAEEVSSKLESISEETKKYAAEIIRLRAKVDAERSEKSRLESELANMNSKLSQAVADARQVPRLRQQLVESTTMQQHAAQETLASIQSLQKDIQGAWDEKQRLEDIMMRVEISDPRKPGHYLRLRNRPEFTCASCRRGGQGWAWKCGRSDCQDMTHIGCTRNSQR